MGKIEDEDDAALCRRMQQGDIQARDMLIIRHERFLRGWARTVGRRAGMRADDLDEAEQEGLCAVFCALGTYRCAQVDANGDFLGGQRCASFRTYSATIAKNRVLNLARNNHRYDRHIAVSLDALLEGGLLERLGRGGCPHTSSPNHSFAEEPDGDSLLRDFAGENLAAAVRALKPKESSLLAIWLQGKTDADAAQCLDISPTAVKLRRHRIIKKLRQIVCGK